MLKRQAFYVPMWLFYTSMDAEQADESKQQQDKHKNEEVDAVNESGFNKGNHSRFFIHAPVRHKEIHKHSEYYCYQ